METMDKSGEDRDRKSLDPLQGRAFRFEGSGNYTNGIGQVFTFKITGSDPKRVEEYTNALRLSCEVRPAEEMLQEDEATEEQDEKYRSLVEENFRSLELHPELDLEIDFDVVDPKGIELPYVLELEIDPPIALGATDSYLTKSNAKKIKIKLNASEGGVSGSLSGGGIAAVRDQADTYPPTPPKPSAKFKGEAEQPSIFSFSVTGLKENNRYSLSSSTKLEKL